MEKKILVISQSLHFWLDMFEFIIPSEQYASYFDKLEEIKYFDCFNSTIEYIRKLASRKEEFDIVVVTSNVFHDPLYIPPTRINEIIFDGEKNALKMSELIKKEFPEAKIIVFAENDSKINGSVYRYFSKNENSAENDIKKVLNFVFNEFELI